MPELPEVETVRRGLVDHLVGRTITRVEVLHPRATRRQPPGTDFAAVAGQRVDAVRRRGKYLWLALADGDAVIAHLGMSGQFRFVPTGTPDHPHLRIRFGLTGLAPTHAHAAQPDSGPDPLRRRSRPTNRRDEGALGWSEQPAGREAPPCSSGRSPEARSAGGRSPEARSAGGRSPEARSVGGRSPEARSAGLVAAECLFLDQRTFGGMQLSPGGAELPSEIAHIGRDLLDPELDRAAVVERIRHKHVGTKRVLLDQTVTSGIGNIYADEALWAARLHGERWADTLSRPRVNQLLDAVTQVFDEALSAGGTSFDSLYVNVNGESGYFGRSLKVYGQTGRPCPRCGTAVRRASFMNRSSHFCPRCQPVPRARRVSAGVGRLA